MNKIYFDHSATTPVDPRVVDKMMPCFSDIFGNSSSIHSYGREAKIALSEAREAVAAALNAKPAEIIFTSGGTEADNLAIKGVAARENKRRHIITSRVEHHAVLRTCQHLEKQGFRVTYLPVDEFGMVHPDQVRNAITEDTFLISVMHANNEVGTINPIAEIGAIAREHKIYFHTDAVQSFGKLPLDVQTMNIDLLSVSGHKIYGPKGVGALYMRRGVLLEKLAHGGHHEYNHRAGTENIPGIVGFGEAVRLSQNSMPDEMQKLEQLRDELYLQITTHIPDVRLNGHPRHRLPGHLNLTFDGIEGEALLISLDMKGIAVSSGSACTAGTPEPSHVLLAMGINAVHAQSSLRFTLGSSNSNEDINYTMEVLPKIVETLRSLSPLYRKK